MIAVAQQARQKPIPAWHTQFLPMMPAIITYARVAFCKLRADAREDMVQEALANSLVTFERLVELGKADLAYPVVLARYAIAQVRHGRRVGGSLNVGDVSSEYSQRRKGFVVERLDEPASRGSGWREIVVEDRAASPADTAALRIDIETWLNRLPGKQRRAAKLLATGEQTYVAAKRLRLSPGRISQMRRELRSSWDEFQRQANDRAA